MAMHPNSLKNLEAMQKHPPQCSHEQMVENAKKGAAAAAASKRRKKEMKKRINEIFEMSIKGGTPEDFNSIIEADHADLCALDKIVLAQFKKAFDGDTKAAEFLRDTAGQKPVEKQEVKSTIRSAGKLGEVLKALEEDEEKED